MAHKRAVRKQQDTSRPAATAAASAAQDPVAHLRRLAEAFNAAVAQSVEDADAEAVHRLRTGSRRVQAMLEATLREAGPAGNAFERPARAWLRALKQIRRPAGAVRDLGVQRKLLENWIDKRIPKQAATDGPEPSRPQPSSADGNEQGNDPSALRGQAEALDAWLKNERRRLAHGMQKQIRKRQQGLAERQSALFAAMAHGALRRPRVPRSADAVALEYFVRAADAMPLLHGENLHAFRKATKKARYVAESGAEGQRYSSVAKALKQVQDAIGEWHDWLCLAEEAKAAMGQDAPELTAALRRQVERHFAAAMKTTESLRGQLTGEWIANGGSKAISPPPAKRPPATSAIGGRRIAFNRRSA
jgi:CHAD domain-containing protein